jgi:gas vesicle protein
MRSLVAFLIGLIIGGTAILFLPDARRENLNTELRGQIDTLQKQLQDLGGQLKDIKLPTPAVSPAPTPTPTPT